MKIAMVLDDSIDRPDGVQQYVLTLGEYLRGAGHVVHYLCSTAHRDDVTVHSLARNVGVTFNGNGLRIPFPASRRRVRDLLSAQAYDIVHVQIPHSPLLAARVVDEARRLHGAGVRIVGTFHILPAGRMSAVGTHLLGRLLRRNLYRFDGFAAVSPPAADFARAAFHIDAEVIPCTVDTAVFDTDEARSVAAARASATGGPLTVVFLGRLVTRKGVLELIDAVATLPDNLRRRLRVRIGGKGPLRDAAVAAIDRHGLGAVVTLEGFVSEADKAAFYAAGDLAVFPATGGESFGIVLIEAMASGAGVVMGGDNPGYRSVLGDDDHVSVDPADTSAFAATLARVLGDEVLRESIHRDQQQRLQQFDVGTVGTRILGLYRGD